MFSSIHPPYSTPTSSAPSSVTLQRRNRTISEPPPRPEFNNSETHTSPRFQYRQARGATSSLCSTAGKKRRSVAFQEPAIWTPPDFSPINSKLSAPSVGTMLGIDREFDDFEEEPNNVMIDDRKITFTTTEKEFVQDASGLDDVSTSSNEDIELESMHIMLTQIFEPFMTPENKADLEELISDRSGALVEHKIGTEELSRRLSNADAVDNTTGKFFGVLSSLGFIVGTQAGTGLAPLFKAYLPAAALPYMPGAVIGIVDRFINSVLRDTHPNHYNKGNPDTLEKIMQDNLERHQRPLRAEMKHQAGALAAAYTIRNVARSVVAPAAAHFGQAALVDTLIDGLGGLPAGAYAECLRNGGDRRELLMHPAYLLGQENWMDQLEGLQHDPLSRQRIDDLIYRIVGKIPDSPQIVFNAFKRLFTLNSTVEISMLMASLALNEWVKETVTGAFEESSPETSAFLKNTVGTCFLGALYYTLGASMTVAATLSKMMECRGDSTTSADVIPAETTSRSSVRGLRRARTPEIKRY
ncbi:MAG: type effector protein RopAA [Herbaspirillum sp.]|nr:type effector protein RopAA [Herbaspirillum sp.]